MKTIHLDTADFQIFSTMENDRRLPSLVLEDKQTGEVRIGHAYSANQADLLWDIFILTMAGQEMDADEFWERTFQLNTEPTEAFILSVFRRLPIAS